MKSNHIIKNIVKTIIGSDIYIDNELSPSQFIEKYWNISKNI